MTIEKREEIIGLYDIYGSLLTDKQKDYFESYYFADLSISEIASNFEVSRNAVFDQIKRVNLILMEYEGKLKIFKKTSKIEQLKMSKALKEEILNILKE